MSILVHFTIDPRLATFFTPPAGFSNFPISNPRNNVVFGKFSAGRLFLVWLWGLRGGLVPPVHQKDIISRKKLTFNDGLGHMAPSTYKCHQILENQDFLGIFL